jgi:serine protease
MRVVRLSIRARLIALAGAGLIVFGSADTPRDARAQSMFPPQPGLTLERALALADARARKLNYIPGEVLIRFKKGVTGVGQQRALLALRSRPPVSAMRWLGEIALLKDPGQPNAHILAQQLSEQPEVMYAEPNYLYRKPVEREIASPPAAVGARPFLTPRPLFTPNDPDFQLQWNFARPALNMQAAWDLNEGGDPSVIVAVVDTGFTVNAQTITFPIPTGTGVVNAALPFAPSPQLPLARVRTPFDFAAFNSTNVIDFEGHGTHVTSTIAEITNNGANVAGMAFNVSIMPVKVCVGFWEVAIAFAQAGIGTRPPSDAGDCSVGDIIQGVNFAVQNGARVINISLGGGGQSLALRDALASAVANGTFVAVAMGNEFQDGNPTQFPAGFASPINGLMAVAALSRNLGRASYSSTGAHCEIAAPGGDFGVGGQAGLIFQTTLRQSDLSPFIAVPRFDRYDVTGFQGTSMASPHVAGLAALIISQNPSITPAAIEFLLRGTARDVGAEGRDQQTGFGMIEPTRAIRGQGIGR